jgi:hypothetical protein
VADYRAAIADALIEAIHRALSPKVIQHAWKVRALYPFHPAAVLDRLPEQREGTAAYFAKHSTTRPRIDGKWLTSETVIASFKDVVPPADDSANGNVDGTMHIIDFDGIVQEAEKRQALKAAKSKPKVPAYLAPVVPQPVPKATAAKKLYDLDFETPPKQKRPCRADDPQGQPDPLDRSKRMLRR